jgi:hypothetical protein
MIEFTDAEVKEDLWAWNDFQDRMTEGERKQAFNENELLEPVSINSNE